MIALAWLLACGRDDPSPGAEAPTDSASGVEDTAASAFTSAFASCDGVVALTTCPEDALTFDASGEVHLELDWTWSPACFASVAAPIYLLVPDDAISLTVTVDAGLEATQLDAVRDGDFVYPGPDFVGYTPEVPAMTLAWPETVDGSVAGCWAVFPRTGSLEPDTTFGQLDLYVRRGAPGGTVPIVGVIVDDAPITPADVEAVLAVAAERFSDGGVTIEVAPTEAMAFAPGAPLRLGIEELDLRRAWTDPAGTGAIPVFFVPEFEAAGIIGRAGGIPGSPRAGTASSGVVVSTAPLIDPVSGEADLPWFGQLVTHELGHQLGLWHTSERTGDAHDQLDDTPECTVASDANGDSQVDLGECWGSGGENVMFWESSREGDQVTLTPDQLAMVGRAAAVTP